MFFGAGLVLFLFTIGGFHITWWSVIIMVLGGLQFAWWMLD
jgi:membrane protein implicated in regulation of membrane protease activity